MIIGFGNNVVSSLAADITASQTTIQVMPGVGAMAPLRDLTAKFAIAAGECLQKVQDCGLIFDRLADTVRIGQPDLCGRAFVIKRDGRRASPRGKPP
ncbi:hypothetical protein [Salmonella enterica]|uniref:Uncharacterized protein n=1 Tax=Salmonella enterica subsp. enterica serovar Dessau TaxID=2564349 RepID=A0A8E5IMD8_SALET|nr:hypothetical protein [Salmonella enterica]QUS46997.1 hypothetical protein F1331_24180 [Salmonella enterica subsp. enterica serovar Dessau]